MVKFRISIDNCANFIEGHSCEFSDINTLFRHINFYNNTNTSVFTNINEINNYISEYLDNMSYDICYYSKFFNEYFQSSEQYKEYIISQDTDFIKLVTYEELRFYISIDSINYEYYECESEAMYNLEKLEFKIKEEINILKKFINNVEMFNECIDNNDLEGLSMLESIDTENLFKYTNQYDDDFEMNCLRIKKYKELNQLDKKLTKKTNEVITKKVKI